MKISVLYLDDETKALELFDETFRTEYDVRTTASPSEARRFLQQEPADIIICDQKMPEITGTEFLIEVARDHPSSYRVMLTGSMTAGEAIPEIASGIVQLFIPKPWTTESMRAMLERAQTQTKAHRHP